MGFRKVSRSPGAGIAGGCELMWVLELNSDPLEQQQVLLFISFYLIFFLLHANSSSPPSSSPFSHLTSLPTPHQLLRMDKASLGSQQSALNH